MVFAWGVFRVGEIGDIGGMACEDLNGFWWRRHSSDRSGVACRRASMGTVGRRGRSGAVTYGLKPTELTIGPTAPVRGLRLHRGCSVPGVRRSGMTDLIFDGGMPVCSAV